MAKKSITFTVNGKKVDLDVAPGEMLVDVLRGTARPHRDEGGLPGGGVRRLFDHPEREARHLLPSSPP